ncbi:MAG: Na+/H+ antiporter NhaA [Bacteroidetes bacterium]|nr:MAG: Na+/H+ antiporter NhaA [Bacteroidota bacterium]
MVKKILRRTIFSPLDAILKDSRSVGIILFSCAIISLAFSNWAFTSSYSTIWLRELNVSNSFHLPHTLLHWINDGLMSIFFFLVGMEIKREILTGELSSVRKSLLPIGAAIGGMIFPAIIFYSFNNGTEFVRGWGIPVATDIAFSLGIATLLGPRVPMSLKIFLTALAIIDDLGAIVVIAIFYGSGFHLMYAGLAVGIIVLLLLLLFLKVRFGMIQILLGLCLWYCVFNSGIHATIAGVIFAFTVPTANLDKLEHLFHKPVNFLILPLFALANTAIILPREILSAIDTGLSWGIVFGLFIGKPLGIIFACFVLVKMKWGELPAGVGWPQMVGIGLLAGIGFTMSIFIAMLAFSEHELQNISKIGVLLGSIISIVAGLICLGYFGKRLTEPQ